MKGDFSRNTFNSRKHYSGVLMQQGRVQLDADWNEQLAIQHHRTETEAKDVIGLCGVPKESDGFKLELIEDDLAISPGRIYVDGLLCELESTPVPITFIEGQAQQIRMPFMTADEQLFEAGQWLEVSADGKPPQLTRITSADQAERLLEVDQSVIDFHNFENPAVRRVATYTSQPSYPSPKFASQPDPDAGTLSKLSLTDGTYLAYLHVWEEQITALDDPLIREKALGGPDSTTRVKTVWQLELLPVVNGDGDETSCETQFTEWDDLVKPSAGRMNARTHFVEDPKNPCVLPPSSGYRRLENQLYRVEIQQTGQLNEATFKWSRENGSVLTSIKTVQGNTLTVTDVGKDEFLSFAGGNWAEIIDDEAELKGEPHPLVHIKRVDPAKGEIELDSLDASFQDKKGLRLRRWDQPGESLPEGLKTDANWIGLEGGIEVRFSGGSYRAGDYWLIPARTATGDIEWPPFEIPNANPIPQPPVGIRHHYCRLALLKATGGALALIGDCREAFPPLTGICAEDVCFDPAGCPAEMADAETVQDALEALCKAREDGCTFVAIPGRDLQALFDAIPDGGDAHICFQVGTYQLPATATMKNKGHIKISGCGPGTRLVAAEAEAALAFNACRTVTIRDIYAEAGMAGAQTGKPTEHLNGTLTFLDCEAVSVQNVALKCGASTQRAATCVTVRNGINSPRPVRIQHCDLSVGHQQEGILLVNVERAHVEDNVLRVYEKPESLKLPELLKDPQQRANVRMVLISGAHLGLPVPPGNRTNVSLSFGNHVIQFKTHNSLRKAWQPLLDANPPGNINNARGLLAHVTKLADRILLDEAFRKNRPSFKTLFDALFKQDRSVASQGITIGGQSASDVRLVNNTIREFLQGIHIGLSRKAARNQHDLAGGVTIAGNTISILLTPDAGKRDRHGIFVGNCQSLLVENNNVQLERLPEADTLETEGIRVWGVLGNKALVTQNHLFSADGNPKRSFDTGINVNPLAKLKPSTSLWLVHLNAAPSKQTTVRVANGAVSTGNVP